MPAQAIRKALLGTLRLTTDDLNLIDGPLYPARLMALYEGDHSSHLRDPPLPPTSCRLRPGERDLFAAIRQRDILLHHPYESFDTVVEFLEQSARDPGVLAIKQTLYRTGGDTRIVGALMEAAAQRQTGHGRGGIAGPLRRSQQHPMEPQAGRGRASMWFMAWSATKSTARCAWSSARRHDGIRRYVHLSTGNYNPTTARLYTDLGLLTCQPDFGEDATNVFNLLTGIGPLSADQKTAAVAL